MSLPWRRRRNLGIVVIIIMTFVGEIFALGLGLALRLSVAKLIFFLLVVLGTCVIGAIIGWFVAVALRSK
jgi:hypothetical protein